MEEFCSEKDQMQHSRKDHSRFIVMSVFAKLFDSWCMVLSGGDVLDIWSLFYQYSEAIETKIKQMFSLLQQSQVRKWAVPVVDWLYKLVDMVYHWWT